MSYFPNNPNGQTTKANSAPVTLASDQNNALETGGNLATIATNTTGGATAANQSTANTSLSSIATNTAVNATSANQTNGTQQTKITDGTNIVSVLKSDGTAAGQNAQIVAGGGYTTGTLTLNSGSPATAWFDMLNYSWVSVEILTNTTPATLTFQTSGDASEANVSTTSLISSSVTTTGPVVTTTSATATFHGPRTGRYFRVSSNNGAGTTTLVITFFTVPSALQTMFIAQGGTWTVQPGNTANTTAWKVDGSAVTQPVSYATTGSGTATGALRVEMPTNGTGTVGLNAGTNNIGQVSVAPQTANGLSVFNATSSDGATALTSTAQAIKASAGQLYGWYIYNPNATAQFVQLYNVASASVTVGTTNPLFMLTIPATSAANVEMTNGITFSNAGWSCAATSTAGGNGAPGTALDCVLFYK